MRKIMILNVAAALLLPATPVFGADVSEKKNDADRLICKSTGDAVSRIPRKKVCKTRAEWNQLTKESVDGVARLPSKGR